MHGWLSCFPRFYDYWNALRSDIEANEMLWSVGLRKRSLKLKTAVSSLQFFFVLVSLSSKDGLTLPNHLVILFFKASSVVQSRAMCVSWKIGRYSMEKCYRLILV